MRVIKLKDQEEKSYLIIDDSVLDEFVPTRMCDCYDEYGIKVGRDRCCCSHEDEGEGENETEKHYEVIAITYWAGSKWQTFFMGNDTDWDNGILLNEDDEESLRIIQDFENVDWERDNYGYIAKTEKELWHDYTGKYTFAKGILIS